MTTPASKDELALLHRSLMPVLSKAAVGDFSGTVEIDPANSQEVNEILMGVEVLLEVIREKIAELEVTGAQAGGGAGAGGAIGRSQLLDEVLTESAD